VRDGFAWGHANDKTIEAFVEMDCDFSHEPTAIPQGIRLLEQGADDGPIGWPLSRRVFSFFANSLARLLIDRKIYDYTNGFRFYKRDVVSFLLSAPQEHKGYIYLSESLSYLLKKGYRVSCFPIKFVNRKRGVSNTNLSEIKNAFFGILSISLKHRFKK
jgi:dolichol-phosphate mannosyltransferase